MATLQIRPDIREQYSSLFGARPVNGRTLVVEDLIAGMSVAIGAFRRPHGPAHAARPRRRTAGRARLEKALQAHDYVYDVPHALALAV